MPSQLPLCRSNRDVFVVNGLNLIAGGRPYRRGVSETGPSSGHLEPSERLRHLGRRSVVWMGEDVPAECSGDSCLAVVAVGGGMGAGRESRTRDVGLSKEVD